MATNNDSTGVDNITQGSGNDTITITLQADIQVNDYFNGGTGTDTILVSSTTGVNIDISSMGISSTTGFHSYEALAFNNTSGTFEPNAQRCPNWNRIDFELAGCDRCRGC